VKGQTMRRSCTIMLLVSITACAGRPPRVGPDVTSLHPVTRNADTVTACLEAAFATRAAVSADGVRTIRYRDGRGRIVRELIVSPRGVESMVQYRRVRGTEAPSPFRCLAIEPQD